MSRANDTSPPAPLHLHGVSLILNEREAAPGAKNTTLTIKKQTRKLFYHKASLFQLTRTQKRISEQHPGLHRHTCTSARRTRSDIHIINLPDKGLLGNQDLRRIAKAEQCEDFHLLFRHYNILNTPSAPPSYQNLYHDLYLNPVIGLQDYIRAQMTDVDGISKQLKDTKLICRPGEETCTTPEITVDDCGSESSSLGNDDDDCLMVQDNSGEYLKIPTTVSDVSCECRPP